VSFLVTDNSKSYQIFSRVLVKAAPRLDVMDLKAFDLPARLATPAVPLEHVPPQFPIGSWAELEPWPPGTEWLPLNRPIKGN
jgi:hypothetical protein